MSGQSAKKKRIGSRRRVANQNKTPEPDEFHITDRVPEAQIKEENTDSLDILADADNSQSETQNPPSSETAENRRKLGSSRRRKGGQHVTDSATETYHKPGEDVEEETRGYENPRATQMSLEIQPQRQEQVSQGSEHIISAPHDSSLYSAITSDYPPEAQTYTTDCLEPDQESLIPKSENLRADQDEYGPGYKVSDESDTFQSEDFKEDAHLVGASELSSFGVLSCPTMDQQLIDQSNSNKMPEELSNIDSVTEKESEERDGSTDLSGQDGNLQGNYWSESHVESADTRFSSAPEKTTDESSPRETIEFENSIEQATCSSPKDKEQNEHVNFQVKEAPHSEDPENNLHDQEFKATQIHDIDPSSENVTHDATEKSDIISGNLINQSEVSDTYRSESILETADDSAAKQEDSNPDDRQDVHAVNENSLEALDHKNEDYHLYDAETPQISGNERLDTAAGQVCPADEQAEDETKPSVEPTVHQEKEELLSETQESDSSSQTLPSEIQDRLELDDTGFSPTRSRRKLGSSRRIKGRHHAKDSDAESHHRLTEEVAGNISDNEALETTNISLTVETTVQEKSEETMAGGTDTFVTTETEENTHVDTLIAISEFTTSTVEQQLINQSNSAEMPEEQLSDSVTEKQKDDGDKDTDVPITPEIITEKVNPGKHDGIESSDEQTAFSSSKAELPPKEEQKDHVNLSEGRGSLHSEGTVNEVHEEADRQTQMQEMHEIDLSTAKESKSSLQTLQSEMNAPLDSQSQGNYVRIKEETHTGINPIGNRRKLGSSRRNKSRQQAKDCEAYHEPKEEVGENTRGGESTVNDEENIEKPPEEDSQNIMDNSEIATIDITSGSHKDDAVKSNEEGKSPKTEPENLWQTAGHDEVTPSAQDPSDIQNISYHRSVTLDILEQEDTNQVQTTEAVQQAETEPSQEVTHAELFHPVHVSADASAEGVPEESGASTAVGAFNTQQRLQEKSNLVNSENANVKRRKMGSTRRSQLSGKPKEGMGDRDETKESDLDMQAEIKHVDTLNVVEELPITAEASQNENATPPLNLVYDQQQETDENSFVQIGLQSIQSNMSDIHDLTALLPVKSDSNNQEVINPVPFIEVAENMRNSERNVDVVAAPAVAVVDLEIVTSEVRGGGGEEHTDAQAHVADKVDQGVQNKSLEMKNPSPDLISASRRRKMGSTRRNLVPRRSGEGLHQKQELENEATDTPASVGDVKTESFRGKDKDSEQTKELVFETVESSRAIESHFKPPSHQTLEENPAPGDHLDETEHQLSPRDFPALPSTPPKHDVMSETASSGRRRKLGSHRKSRGHQSKETAATEREDGSDVRSIIEESAIKTAGGESLRLGKISEADESDKKPSPSNIGTSKAGEHPRPVSEETQVPPVSAVIPLSPERPRTFSLAGRSRAAASRSNTYNVMMVGDSSVGKTSFMKRAQSGKFSLDVAASVGLDSCMWNVVVDGKPVVLHLWDTAGQERFHSITRQIFHKAQAFLLMYDITSSKSFSAVSYWANCIQEGAAEDVTILLLGNKSDHAERRIKTEEGESLAKEYKFEFMECSAATGENVVQSLETVARVLSQKADTRGETTVLHKEPQQKKSSGCC